MNRTTLFTALGTLILAAALTSCGTRSESGGNLGAAEATSGGLAPLSQRLNEEQGYVRDANGNWVPRNNRRSQFENRTAAGVNRDNAMGNSRFRANEFQTAEWTRTRSNTPQPFTGNTAASGFQTTAAAQGQAARQSGAQARTPGNFQTPTFATGASREDSARRHDRPAHAQTTNRGEIPIQPDIIDWRQQRDLGLDQTRSMLAR